MSKGDLLNSSKGKTKKLFGDDEQTWESFDIRDTAEFIVRRGFVRVALQFPDEMLKHSVFVTLALKNEINKLSGVLDTSPCSSDVASGDDRKFEAKCSVQLFVMADSTFGSCCADEVAAMHVDAQCIVHYGHACFSQTSRLPVWFVFVKGVIDVEDCALHIMNFASTSLKPLLVLLDLKYTNALSSIQERVSAAKNENMDLTFGEFSGRQIEPSFVAADQTSSAQGTNSLKHSIGGLHWALKEGRTMEDYITIWIGSDGPALFNALLTYSTSTIVRYDPSEKRISTDNLNQSKFLRRRYYLVERAKDASIVGIVVGTLGVSGYGEVIKQLQKMVAAVGKKAYTLVMGKPTPAKLANFPECEIFVLVACSQTVLVDSKEYLAPIITPFEAELAFKERIWTGAYSLELSKFLANSNMPSASEGFQGEYDNEMEDREARFSFLRGGYVGSVTSPNANHEGSSKALVLSQVVDQACQKNSFASKSLISTDRCSLDIRSSAEYLSNRTYQGLEISKDTLNAHVSSASLISVVGRSGRAVGYTDEAACTSKSLL